MLNGRLVENLHVENARRVLALADRIGALEDGRHERGLEHRTPAAARGPHDKSTGGLLRGLRLGETILHATPRTVTAGDVALYTALTGSRFALQSSDAFARSVGLPRAPVDDLLVFHIAFGKTVPDISLNAVANLGYAECQFQQPVYPGDTLAVVSEVIGLRATQDGKAGIVYVRSNAKNQAGDLVLTWVRWVMVERRDRSPCRAPVRTAAMCPSWTPM